VARRYRGRDVVAWLADMGYYDMPVQDHPLKQGVRAKANHYVTGRDGGRDIDLRRFALEGMVLHGRLQDIAGDRLLLGDDLARNLDSADATSESIKRSIDAHIARLGLDVPEEAPYVPCWRPEGVTRELDLAREGIGCVIWSMGYRSDFRFVELPVFDEQGHPRHERGVTPTPGLFFLGLPWLHTWGSGRFSGVKRDAAYLLERILECRSTSSRGAREATPQASAP
jgi:putative flavoprotein involved in K+ transport